MENSALPDNEKLDVSWGLLNLFKTPEKSIIRPNMFFKPRMVEVSELFDQSQNAITIPSASKPTTPTAAASKSKSSGVRQQIQNIKMQARSDLKQMRANAANGDIESVKGRRR